MPLALDLGAPGFFFVGFHAVKGGEPTKVR